MISLKTILITIVLFLTVNLKSQNLQINEVVSRNYNGLLSFENKTEDWIEIYNNSLDTINLQNYYLSDDDDNYQLWQFPYKKLAPDSFLVVFASGKNIVSPELHTSFKLTSEGESIYLSSNVLIDSISMPALNADNSFGRIAESSNQWSILDIPSPHFSNAESNFLSFSHESGFYDEEIYLEVNSLRPHHTIYYTTNGREPTTLDKIWSNDFLKNATLKNNNFCNVITTAEHPILEHKHVNPKVNINKTNVLKFASFSNQIKTSRTNSKTFFVGIDHYELPVLSIIIDSLSLFDEAYGIYTPGIHWDVSGPEWTGNYTKRGRAWEKEISISYFDKNRVLIFEQNAGVRIHGGKSRLQPQKSLRVYARKSYGNEDFTIPHFEGKKYDKFILKNIFSSWNNTMISDYFSLKSSENFNFEMQNQKPVILFLNGEYWGIHYLAERLDADFLSELYEFDSSDTINLLENATAQSGSNEEFLILMQFIEYHDLSDDVNYTQVESKIDIANFIDYHIVEMFFNNYDWPSNNLKIWNVNNGKWRYVLYDLDAAIFTKGDKLSYNMFNHMLTEEGDSWPNPPESNLIFRKLMNNESFKTDFVKRYIELISNDLSQAKLIGVLSELLPDINYHLHEHIDRWNYPISLSEWEMNLKERTINFINTRQCIVNNQMIEALDLKSTTYLCEELFVQLEFTIFPNPAKMYINVQFNNDLFVPSFFNYIITDTKGTIYQKGTKILIFSAKINIQNLVSGIYFFKINDDDNNHYTQKFIVE
tara:strand:- start:1605 stop:3896 length:2292 start_codon:yes stop_codon:yes gene_type:complete